MSSYNNFMEFLEKVRTTWNQSFARVGDLRITIRLAAAPMLKDKVVSLRAEAQGCRNKATEAAQKNKHAEVHRLLLYAEELSANARKREKMIAEWLDYDIDNGWPSDIERELVCYTINGLSAQTYENEMLLISCLYGIGLNVEYPSETSDQLSPPMYMFDYQGLLRGEFSFKGAKSFIAIVNDSTKTIACGEDWMIGDSSEYSDKAAFKNEGYTVHLATDTGIIKAVSINEMNLVLMIEHRNQHMFIGTKLRKRGIQLLKKELLFARFKSGVGSVTWDSQHTKMKSTRTRPISTGEKCAIEVREVSDILNRSGWNFESPGHVKKTEAVNDRLDNVENKEMLLQTTPAVSARSSSANLITLYDQISDLDSIPIETFGVKETEAVNNRLDNVENKEMPLATTPAVSARDGSANLITLYNQMSDLNLAAIEKSEDAQVVQQAFPHICIALRDFADGLQWSDGQLVLLSWTSQELNCSIPESLGKLINLTVLRLELCELTGLIPDSLANLVNLTKFYLQNNELHIWIPSDLKRRMPKLRRLDGQTNQAGEPISYDLLTWRVADVSAVESNVM
ncbi:hypothetical protein HDU76_000593 [Blyttiomyces sp. JEL0837]|nr:hypothetical protein HDU76_000593 [Blyttiomyces sp. JEL0837]